MKTLFRSLSSASLAALAAPLWAGNALFTDALTIAEGKAGQPYLYVGQATHTTGKIALTEKAGAGKVVATIPATDDALVLLAPPDKKHYLVKTRFGTTGWVAADAAFAQSDDMLEDFTASKMKVLENLPENLTSEEEGIPPFVIHYNPERIKPVKPEQSTEGVWKLLEGKFGADDTVYRLECTRGLSADPHCGLLSEEDLKKRADTDGKGLGFIGTDKTFPGETLYFPGDGRIYAAGQLNSAHPYAATFFLKDNAIQEARSMFHYVGLESVAEKAFALADSPQDGKNTVAEVKAGDALTVLLRDGLIPPQNDRDARHYLLIKTSDGTIGWVTEEDPLDADLLIRDYRFIGD